MEKIAEATIGKLVDRAMEDLSNMGTLEEKVTYLGGKLDVLTHTETDIREQVDKDESDIRGKKRKREVEEWLNIVDEKKRECETIIEKARNCTFVDRVWGDLPSEVTQKVKEVMELVEQAKGFQVLVVDTLETKKVSVVTSAAQGHVFDHNLQKIMRYVMNDNVSTIGIQGMGGVGKTTLAMQVHDNLLGKPEFKPKFADRVYWITASQYSTIDKLQNKIAEIMKIDISGEDDVTKRKGLLHDTISKKKGSFALILDDVWEGFDAVQIGIPLKGRKVFITSRLDEVCRFMSCDAVIKVVLSEAESWELFQEKLKSSPTSELALPLDTKKVAQDVAKKCGGLPLGIITIAGSMRGVTDVDEWTEALEELEESFTDHKDMKDKVLPILLHSYNRLRDSKLKSCFLYCSLYPEDYQIRKDELVRRFFYEDMMHRTRSRRASFAQGKSILRTLERACLLVGCKDNDSGDAYVKMHDLIRDMALWITQEEKPRFMVKSGVQLEEVPPEDEWAQNLDRVSLMDNKIKFIPDGVSPSCSNILSLNLSLNPLVSVADSFFVHMKSLQTLDLSDTKIVALPNSISRLVTLKALLLHGCRRLVSLPSLENLTALIELDLYDTSVEVIQGLESLTSLKCFEFQHCTGKDTPSLALHRFIRLQRLILSIEKVVKIEEVMGLKHVEEFQGNFASIDEFRQFISINSQRPLGFCHIVVGEYGDNIFELQYNEEGLSINVENIGETAICDDIVIPLRGIENIRILNAKDMKCLLRVPFDDEKVKNWSPLERLKNLYLCSLPQLKNILDWEGEALTIPPSAATFSRLTSIIIIECRDMKTLFPRCLIDNLISLNRLEVNSCEDMEEIIGEDSTNNASDAVTLPKLGWIVLHHLPELKSICKSTVSCNSVFFISLFGLTKLKKVSLSFPLLNGQRTHINISDEEEAWWESLEWNHYPDHKNIFKDFISYL